MVPRRLVVLALVAGAASCGDNLAAPGPALTVVGASDLGGRGGHAALAVADGYVYVGARVDAVAAAAVGHTADVLIVDTHDPARPEVVGALGPPEQGLAGMSARELRVVPELDLLVVMNIACSEELHGCGRDHDAYPGSGLAEADNLKLYDIAERTAPRHLATYRFPRTIRSDNSPHEFFLWRDPADPARVLLFVATPPGPPGLQVLDLSDPRAPRRLLTWDAIDDGGLPERRSSDNILHSIGVSADGARGYFSHQLGGLFLADLSTVAAAGDAPAIAPFGPLEARVDWAPPEPSGPHSAVEVPGRDLVVVTDEVYPPSWGGGCPWGWLRVVDVADPAAPAVVGELRLRENDPARCVELGDAVTFTAHNATATANLALVSWHEAGLVVADLSDPAAPRELTRFRPTPTAPALVDPALGQGGVAMWSYPVIADGLIYLVDVANGLFILRYDGPFADEIAAVDFAEGNSSR